MQPAHPYDDCAWEGVWVQLGGFPPQADFVLRLKARWTHDGVPAEVQDWYLTQTPEPNTIYVLSDGSRWCFSERACRDVARARLLLEAGARDGPDRRNCASCRRGDRGKQAHRDPEFFCSPLRLGNRAWTEALAWQARNQPLTPDGDYGYTLQVDARDCPHWLSRELEPR